MKEYREIANQMMEAEKTEFDSKWPKATYEAGVIAALKWVIELTSVSPMTDLAADEIKEIMKT